MFEKMSCVRLLGNKLSLFKNVIGMTDKLHGIRNFSSVLVSPLLNHISLINTISKPCFKTNLNLIPVTSCLTQQCGIKVKGKPKLRCKHCYYAGIEGVLHVLCDVYPRHKQRAFMPRKRRYGWILTHACQSKFRPY